MLRKTMIVVTIFGSMGEVVQIAKFQRITSAEDFASTFVARNPLCTFRID